MSERYVVQMSKEGGAPYKILDKTAREMVSAEVTAREAAIAAAISNTCENKGVLEDNSDFNNIQENSIYGIGSSRTYLHKPQITSGFLMTIKYGTGIISQIAFELNYENVYARYLINGDWNEWVIFNCKKTPYYNGVLADESDLDDVLPNEIVGLNSQNTYENMPDGVTSGVLVCLRYDSGTTIYHQYLFTFGDGVFVRYKLSTWSAWKRIDFIDRDSFIKINGYLPNEADFNDYTENGRWSIPTSRTYSNNPLPSSGVLDCSVFSIDGIYCQHAYSLSRRPSYYRWKIFDNEWSDWYSEDAKDPSAVLYAFGDSIVYGQIGGTGGQSANNYPAMTGRLLNMVVKNKAVGGQGLIKDWNAIQSNYITNLDMTDASLILIGWSYNDGAYYSSMNFGAATDTGDTTFIGKYFTIMKQFQQKCPEAQIILVTGYGTPDGQAGPPVVKPTLETQFTYEYTFADGRHTTKEMYDTLEEMANLHGWPCVNQAKGTAFNQFNASDMIGDQIHPTNDGYYRYGQVIAARIAQYYGNIYKEN